MVLVECKFMVLVECKLMVLAECKLIVLVNHNTTHETFLCWQYFL